MNVYFCVCICSYKHLKKKKIYPIVSVCSDGFRKVMHIETGFVKQEKDGPVEFQHPYFKHGQDGLLENIKRKVESLVIFFGHQ